MSVLTTGAATGIGNHTHHFWPALPRVEIGSWFRK